MSRPRAQVMLRRGGDRVARLDSHTASHKMILRAIRVAIPKRFDARRAADLEATFELRVRDPRGGEPAPFTIAIAGGACDVHPGPAVSPGAVATLGADDMIRLVSGAIGWPELLSSGRLEMSGDPFLALRFPSLFRLPART
jgi:SCP-2 sterol transfer family protein